MLWSDFNFKSNSSNFWHMNTSFYLFVSSILLLSCQMNTRSNGDSHVITIKKNNESIAFADTLSTNWIVLKATVYNKPAFLLVDNGTVPQTQLILFKHYAIEQGIIDSAVFLRKEMDRIANLPAAIFINHFTDTLKAEIQTVYNAPIHKMPDGILGKAFLEKYILAVDYDNKTLQIIDSSDFVAPEGYETIQLKPEGPFYSFDAQLFLQGNRFTEKLYLDLGNGHDGFLFGLKFYQKYKDRLNIDAIPRKESFTMFSKSKVADVLVDSVLINGIAIKNIASTIETASSVSYVPLLVGNSVLRNFGNVVFDLGHCKMYFPKGR